MYSFMLTAKVYNIQQEHLPVLRIPLPFFRYTPKADPFCRSRFPYTYAEYLKFAFLTIVALL